VKHSILRIEWMMVIAPITVACTMKFEEWEASLPLSVKRDGTWNVQAYRLSLYFAACAWRDLEPLCRENRSSPVAGQLCRAAGSVAANIAEGYGRRSPVDRARYFEYALGSTSEVRTWYIICRSSLEDGLAEARLEQLASVTRLLLVMIKNERARGADATRGVQVSRSHKRKE
jgi:four helix bundle protein